MADEDYRKLSDSDVKEQMKQLDDWKLEKGKLHRDLEFQSFEDAIAFMVRCSLEVVKLDHHPEWFNVYNKVRIDLVTHDVGGISQYDFLLAKKLDSLAKKYRAK
jgi:4a-hydroxytetrahydrobiopterin dehydratase